MLDSKINIMGHFLSVEMSYKKSVKSLFWTHCISGAHRRLTCKYLSKVSHEYGRLCLNFKSQMGQKIIDDKHKMSTDYEG